MRPTSKRKIRANRTNARASTGPNTTQGRIRSARNALRHALSLPIYADSALSEQIEELAREIAGTNASAEMQEQARRVAEAQIDLRRVRDARHRLLCQASDDSDGGPKPAVLGHGVEDKAFVMPIEALANHLIIRQISLMDRYERRALSRRKFAIRAFDLLHSY